MPQKPRSFETRAVQAGVRSAQDFRPTAPSIHASTTFTYEDAAATHGALDPFGRGFAYSRNANPTVRSLEEAMASLEETEDAVAFASGMAALHAALLATGIKPGESICAARDLYGVTRSMLSGLFGDLGFKAHLVDAGDLKKLDRTLEETDARVLLVEPISNPLLTVADLPAVLERAHAHNAMVIVDNTFPTPYLLRPAQLGADLVVHSATKYLGGHGDVMAGVVACDRDLASVLRSLRTATGGILGPFEAWLVLRGIRTLALRVRRHCENAALLAQWLDNRDDVEKVYYPGLASHPDHERASRLFSDGLLGGMVAFETGRGLKEAEAFMDALELAVPGTSLGDTETLVLCPALSSHRTLTADERHLAGIQDGLMRVSAGLEAVEDIIADFEQALSAVRRPVAHFAQ